MLRLLKIRHYGKVGIVLFIIAIYSINVLNDSDKLDNNEPYELNTSNEPRPECLPTLKESSTTGVLIDGINYPRQSVPLSFNSSINFTCLNRTRIVKRILVWNRFFATNTPKKPAYYSLGNCPLASKCEVTHDRSMLDSSDMVYVHVVDRFTPRLPRNKPQIQQWVFGVYESPIHSRNLIKFNNYFNLTSTYYVNSDFAHFYQSSFYDKFEWRVNESFEMADFSAGKTDLAFGIISNCDTYSQREDVIKELRVHMKLSIYGECGESKCENDCKSHLSRTYKFYLAFENSICDEYITEKFFETLRHPVVPVVLGGGDYEKHIPKSSFINVLDFRTIKQLADYLNYLDKNNTAYNEYFKWRKYLSVRKQEPLNTFVPLCDMCIYLHLQRFYGIRTRVEDRIDYYYDKFSRCRVGSVVSNDQGEKFYQIKPHRPLFGF